MLPKKVNVFKINMAIQTSGPWQKKIRSKERVYIELLERLENKSSTLKRKRRLLLRKGKLKGDTYFDIIKQSSFNSNLQYTMYTIECCDTRLDLVIH